MVHFYSSDDTLVDDVRGFMSTISILYARLRIRNVGEDSRNSRFFTTRTVLCYFAEDIIVFVPHAAILRCKWSSTAVLAPQARKAFTGAIRLTTVIGSRLPRAVVSLDTLL